MFFHNFTLQRNFLHIEPLQRQLFQTGMLHIAQYVQVAVKQHEPFLPVIHVGANAAAKQAAKQGMNTILSPQIPYYINRKQSKLTTEPMSQGHGTETVEAVYNYQPLKDVDAALQPYYKGVQANFWTEWVTEPSVLEYLMLPRLAAVAEAGWTPQEKRNYEDFKERIRKDAELYDLKGWNYGKHIMK